MVLLKGCEVANADAARVDPVHSFLHVWRRAQAVWEEVSLNIQGSSSLVFNGWQ